MILTFYFLLSFSVQSPWLLEIIICISSHVTHSSVLFPDVSYLVYCSPQVSFSEGGPGSNSTGSEVASMSSQLPDTPNSMVSSPIEAWVEAALRTEQTAPVHPIPPVCTKQPLVVFWHCEDNHGILPQPLTPPSRWMRHHGWCRLFTRLVTVLPKEKTWTWLHQ